MGFLFFIIFLGLFFWLGTAFLIASYGRKKQIGFGATFLICLFLSPVVGLVVALLSPEYGTRSTRFEHAYEEARRKEFKGDLPAAIDKYLDALFYLHTDFKKVPAEQLKAHQDLCDIIERKIESLKSEKNVVAGAYQVD